MMIKTIKMLLGMVNLPSFEDVERDRSRLKKFDIDRKRIEWASQSNQFKQVTKLVNFMNLIDVKIDL